MLKSERAAFLTRIAAAEKRAGRLVADDRVRAAEALDGAADDLVALGFERGYGLARKIRLQRDFEAGDVVETRRVDRFLRRHAELDHIQQYLRLHLRMHVAALEAGGRPPPPALIH